jgi:hypothetical protein
MLYNLIQEYTRRIDGGWPVHFSTLPSLLIPILISLILDPGTHSHSHSHRDF